VAFACHEIYTDTLNVQSLSNFNFGCHDGKYQVDTDISSMY
jgi:hypothetical protein